MSQGMALQQERACAAFDCADFSSSLASTGKQPRWRSFFQRCVLLLLVQSLLLGAAQAVPVAVVEPTTIPLHRTAAIGLSVGNPILPATAEKFQSESDFNDPGAAPLSFGRFYRSTWGADATRPAGTLGAAWTHTHSASLHATPGTHPTAVSITSAEGYVRTFAQPAGASFWSATNSADSLTWTPTAWIYRRADDDSTSQFDAAGKLLTHTARNGRITRYTYDAAGQLITVTNAFGRTLALAYNSAGLLSTLTTPDGRSIGYAYDAAARLAQVSYPDGKTRGYLYENAAFPKALTGIVDEGGMRLSAYAYDAQGRAISSERAGGVDRYQVSYPAASTATITDPLGVSRTYTYSTTLGKLAVTGSSLPSATGEADAASRVQDANGLIARETDFKGVSSSTTWDAARRLPLSVVHAAGTAAQKSTTTEWHPSFSLPLLVTQVSPFGVMEPPVSGILEPAATRLKGTIEGLKLERFSPHWQDAGG
jgi:YD repeat-containing protein